MKILIVGLVENLQLKRVIEEGEKRGYQVEGCYASELVISCDKDSFNPTLRGKKIDHDLIYIWAVGKRRWEWYTTAYFLKEKEGVVIVNGKVVDPSYNYYLTPALDYLKQTKAKLKYPKSAVIFSPKSVDEALSGFSFPVVIKISGGRQGRGVFKVGSKEEIVKVMEEWKEKSPSFVIREFIPNDGDIRIFTVGYKAIGAMKRMASDPNEFRSNISLGGKGEKFDLTKYPEVTKIAEKLSEITATEIAGVDIMLNKETNEPYILEINPGPQFTGFEKYTGINAAEEIIKYFENLCSQKK